MTFIQTIFMYADIKKAGWVLWARTPNSLHPTPSTPDQKY